MAVRKGTVRQHGLALQSMSRITAATLAMLVCITMLPGAGLAAPEAEHASTSTSEVNLGGGSYSVVASIFAEGTDGQAGTQASSGKWITRNDNLVALPACTQSSCPWVATGTGVEGRFGPQTTCAEADGLCWVKIVSATTGQCTVAPVHDRGPLFIKDNYWAPQSQRTYDVPQGIPAAVYARDGANFGFGAGKSDVGHDIQNVYRYAAGIDLAEGTWKALGLPVSAGITNVTVTMLWQAGINHTQACGSSSGSTPAPDPAPTTPNANASTTTSLNLRTTASLSGGIVTVIPSGGRVQVTGSSQNGFYPLKYGSNSGWASGNFLKFDAGQDPGQAASSGSNPPPATTTGPTATVVGGALNMRSGAGTNFGVIAVLPNAATVTLTGQTSGSWKSISYNGLAGWAFGDYLSTGGSTSGTAPPATSGTAVTSASLNMRSGAGAGFSLLKVVPSGATVSLTSNVSNGYTQVVHGGTTGWVLSIYLGSGSAAAPPPASSASATGPATVINGALNLRSGPGTNNSVLLVMPGGASVTLLGESSNGFVKLTYQGTTGWASSTYIQQGGSTSSSGSGTATVIDGALNLRSSASTASTVLLVMPGGANVTLLGETQNGFTRVTYNGTTGWAYSIYLR